jgi:multiple sugar transport system substrate-binding protein
VIRLRGVTWDHPRGYQPLAASAEPYARMTGVQVEWEKRSLKDFGDAPIDRLARDYDILIVDHPHVGLAEATQCLIPLEEHVPADMMAELAERSAGPSHQSYFYHGHQWVLAVDAAMQASAYRPDLIDIDIPNNWDAVLNLAGRLRKAGRWMAVPLVPTDCICSFLSLCASLGDPPGQAGDLLADDAVGHHALELLKQFAIKSHPQSMTWNPIRMLDHMSSNDDVAYCPLTFTYTNYSRDGYAPKLVRYTNMPLVSGAILGGAGYSVSSHCQHIPEAVAYGVWLCGAEVQRTLYVENGGQPGNGVAWHDDRANEITHNFFRSTWDTLANAYVRPRHNGYHSFQEQAGNRIHKMLREREEDPVCLADVKALYRASK